MVEEETQMSDAKPITTGEAAKYCHVSQATVVNWIKEGKLKAYATPGGHHRILLSDLLSFLRAYHMPVDKALRNTLRQRILVVSDSPQVNQLVEVLQANAHLDVVRAGDDYEASAQIARFGPDVVVLDMTSATLNCLALCRWLRASPEGEATAVLAVGAPEDRETACTAGADVYLPTASAADRLEAELEALLGAGKH